MRIVVTGGAGFIGSNLVRLAVGRGHRVLSFDKLTYAGNRASLADLEGNPLYQLTVADICDAAAVRAALAGFQPDAILHLAAESHVDRSIDGPGPFIHTNVVGTLTLLEAALDHWRGLPADRRARFRFLHVSTDEVYGSLDPGDPAAKFSETTRYDPHSPYSASKAASDHLARAWHSTYGLPVLVTNCSNNYGPFQFPEKLIPMVILKALAGQPIPVYGRGENVRDWLHVGDHCRALLTVLDRGTPGETYNIGGDNELRNIDLVRSLCRILDQLLAERAAERQPKPPRAAPSPLKTSNLKLESLIHFVPDRPGHDLRYAIDASRIRSQLGWSPTHDHSSGFRHTIAWYLDNQPWWQPILDGTYRLQRLGAPREE